MRAVLAVIASMALVACVGQLDTMPDDDDNSTGSGSGTNPNPQGSNSQAKKKFEETVWPIISQPNTAGMSGCAGAGCHQIGNSPGSTQFVAQTMDEGWVTVTSFTSVHGNFIPTAAGILTKIGDGGLHSARVYTAAEKQAITDWLTLEATERAGGGGGGSGSGGESPGAASARLMNAWSSCLTLADFQTANMSQAWNGMQAEGNNCNACHNTGYANFIVTNTVQGTTPPGFFTTISTVKEYMMMWFNVDLSVTGPDGKRGKMIINQQAFDGVSKRQAPHATHPSFNSTNSNGMTALRAWYDLTMAKVTAAGATGNCGPTTLNPPAI
jgi:hypothetical protein